MVRELETPLAQAILAQSVSDGDTVEVEPETTMEVFGNSTGRLKLTGKLTLEVVAPWYHVDIEVATAEAGAAVEEEGCLVGEEGCLAGNKR